ncbi:MAG: hypothetical protein IT557_09905 [Alphaproteobacteria bacterium]|nr:hypothetical protein [Alphaproteobacteria bacterium]
MSGLFGSPSPPPPPPPPAEPDPAVEAEARRKARVERLRRGLAGTIATSERGVLDPAWPSVQRKSLLGE